MIYDLLALSYPGEGWLVRFTVGCNLERMQLALEAGQYHA